MSTVLYRSMMVFALLASFSVCGDVEQPDCRSWWSEMDGVHHCLLSGNLEDGITTHATEKAGDTKALSDEPFPDDISAQNNIQQVPPSGFRITDIPEK